MLTPEEYYNETYNKEQPTISKMERVKTAVEWFHDKVDDLISDELRERFELLKNEAKQMEREQHGLFLHWFVKHYETATIDGMFGFVDAMGKEVTVKEIVDHYYNETYGK